MAGHDHVYGICENKCFVEVSPKTDVDGIQNQIEIKELNVTNKWITQSIPALIMNQLEGFERRTYRKKFTMDDIDSLIGETKLMLPLSPFPSIANIRAAWFADIRIVAKKNNTITATHVYKSVAAVEDDYTESNYSDRVIYSIDPSTVDTLIVEMDLELLTTDI